jgi:hypothetical protein
LSLLAEKAHAVFEILYVFSLGALAFPTLEAKVRCPSQLQALVGFIVDVVARRMDPHSALVTPDHSLLRAVVPHLLANRAELFFLIQTPTWCAQRVSFMPNIGFPFTRIVRTAAQALHAVLA